MIKIAIPSYRRFNWIQDPRSVYETVKELDPVVVIRADEADVYDIPDKHKAILPDGIKHIGDTREWILRTFGHGGVLMLDDDTYLETLTFEGTQAPYFKCEKSFDIEVFKERLRQMHEAGPFGCLGRIRMPNATVYHGVRQHDHRMYFETSYYDLDRLPGEVPDLSKHPMADDAVLALYYSSHGIRQNMVGDINCVDPTFRKHTPPAGGTWEYRQEVAESAIDEYISYVDSLGYPEGTATKVWSDRRKISEPRTDNAKVIRFAKLKAQEGANK